MILTKKFSKQFFSFALIFSVIFSGQNIGHAEEKYSDDLIPTMTDYTSPSGTITADSEYSSEYLAYKAFNDASSEIIGWAAAETNLPHWHSFEFSTPKVISKYTLKAEIQGTIIQFPYMPRSWEFQGYDALNSEWVTLDTRTNVSDWPAGEKREFMFENSTAYNKYRINITDIPGDGNGVAVIGEMEMMEKIKTTPDPDPQPEPTGDNALLVIKMISGLEKEFDLTASEVKDFIDWYDGRADGRGKETYMFDKDFNKGPFTSRKDYVAFSKIQSFEVMEYTK
ncbi:F5/8 type C domain-containing protein [Brevibacillus sp. AG162]|uniref:discoidin domain-containing protein n=1 Tax=Brevibacillus sp. AG162 TaxID=2572910 RepID=UPI0011507A3F|nr:discoidin domain-containing protein [Brevibacillus sp. AG162]TQK45785.1 F5/8 type C domain-containing protein [Brevibacillus sp. AG162]